MLTRILDWLKNLHSSILFRLHKGHRGICVGDTVLFYWERSASLSPIPGTSKVSQAKVIQIAQWTGYKTYYIELSPGDCIWVHESWCE